VIDIEAFRQACEGDHLPCEGCGDCVFCTYPHRCCCGKCGHLCNHDHAPLNKFCCDMNQVDHEIRKSA
jgi:hypothetical protein